MIDIFVPVEGLGVIDLGVRVFMAGLNIAVEALFASFSAKHEGFSRTVCHFDL